MTLPPTTQGTQDRDKLADLSHRARGCDGTCRPDEEDYRIADMILAAGWISLEQQYQMRARVRDEFVQRMAEAGGAVDAVHQ